MLHCLPAAAAAAALSNGLKILPLSFSFQQQLPKDPAPAARGRRTFILSEYGGIQKYCKGQIRIHPDIECAKEEEIGRKCRRRPVKGEKGQELAACSSSTHVGGIFLPNIRFSQFTHLTAKGVF
jgi:hypothetical protein